MLGFLKGLAKIGLASLFLLATIIFIGKVDRETNTTASNTVDRTPSQLASTKQESTPIATPTRQTVVPQRQTVYDYIDHKDKKYTTRYSSLHMSASIENRSNGSVKDITFKCDIYAKSGTKIATQTVTLFDEVAAKKTLKFKDLRIGYFPDQGNGIDCHPIKLFAGNQIISGD